MGTRPYTANAPNFFLLGGAKCGTTGLYHLLGQHPGLYLAPEKETHFFTSNDYYRRGLRAYLDDHFRGAGGFPIRGEATPAYFHHPADVAPRMRSTLGDDLRFTVILRDPVDRAWSHYLHQRSFGAEPLSFEAALEAEERRRADGRRWIGYFRDGLYSGLLEAWLEHYPRETFLVVLLDDLSRDAEGTTRQLFRFLDLDGGVRIRTEVERNPASGARYGWLGRALNRPARVTNVLKRIVPYRVRQRVRDRVNRWNRRALGREDRPELDADTERELRRLYRDDVERLAGLIGRNLDDWM